MPHSFEIPRRRRLGVRQLAAAFRSQFFAIQIGNHKGASKLAHSKGFAFDKNYAALGETPALPGKKLCGIRGDAGASALIHVLWLELGEKQVYD
jgi:hypothetical protein